MFDVKKEDTHAIVTERKRNARRKTKEENEKSMIRKNEGKVKADRDRSSKGES